MSTTHEDTDKGPVAELEPYQLVNLTKLTWDQPLVASVRLHLSSGDLPFTIPVSESGVPLEDRDLKSLILLELSDGYKSVLLQQNRTGHYFRGDVAPLHYQTQLAEWLQVTFDNRSRTGALLAVILTELGWPVHKIAKALDVSRPTVNKWIMTNASKPITDDELVMFNGASDSITSIINQALVDVRTRDFRSRRSGLTWRKATFLPSHEVSTMLRALWRIGYRVRGERSPEEERVCSYTLDIMLDLLLRRGVTAQNIAKIVGVTHAAVLTRVRRSEVLHNADGKNRFWIDVNDIAEMRGGTLPLDSDVVDTDDLEKARRTVTIERPGWTKDLATDILFSVRTHVQSDKNPSPLPNVYVLTMAEAAEEFAEIPSDELHEILPALYELDSVSPGEVNQAISKAAEGKFAPIKVRSSSKYSTEAHKRMLGHVIALRPLSYEIDSPLTSNHVAAAIYGVDRYSYPGIVDRSYWTEKRVLVEALLVQATGQYDRNKSFSRPGFGDVSYHWVPSEAIGAIIDLTTHEQSKTEIESRRVSSDPTKSSTLAEEHLSHVLENFLPSAAYEAITKWMALEDRSLLWTCLHQPHLVLEEYDKPITHSAS